MAQRQPRRLHSQLQDSKLRDSSSPKCPHFGDEAWERDETNDLGQKLKACALSIAVLHDWANSNGIETISTCGDCRPRESSDLVEQEAVELEKNGYFDPKAIDDTRSRSAREIALDRVNQHSEECYFKPTKNAAQSPGVPKSKCLTQHT